MLNREQVTITMEAFDQFVASHVSWMKKILEDKPDSVMPYLAIKAVDMEGKECLTMCAIATNMNTPDEKRTVLMGLGRKIYGQQQIPVAICFSSEAWVASNPPKNTAPSQCSNRRECIIVAAKDIEAKHTTLVSIPVNRDRLNRMEMAEDEGFNGDGKNVDSPILDHFFRGYAEAAMEVINKTNN